MVQSRKILWFNLERSYLRVSYLDYSQSTHIFSSPNLRSLISTTLFLQNSQPFSALTTILLALYTHLDRNLFYGIQPSGLLVLFLVEIVAEVQEQEMTPFDLNSMDNIRTVLYGQCTDPFYTYHNVNWTLEIRKEVSSTQVKITIILQLHSTADVWSDGASPKRGWSSRVTLII